MQFRFRHFSVKQEQAAMKIGTDSVLLGCFCDPGDAAYILDIGTGTGLLALMLAQRSEAAIDAVEIDRAAYGEASENAQDSPWKDRIRIHHASVLDFEADKKYGCIISNPPYYRHRQNLKIDDLQRSKARHDHSLSFPDLCNSVIKNLAVNGSFWLILPAAEAAVFKAEAALHTLHLWSEILVRPKAGKEINRVIMQFGLTDKEKVQHTFTVYLENGDPSPEYISLTKDFYTGKQFNGG